MLRLLHNMSLEELAAAIGVDRADLGRIEKGLKAPSKRIATRLQTYFGRDTDFLLSLVSEDEFQQRETLTPRKGEAIDS